MHQFPTSLGLPVRYETPQLPGLIDQLRGLREIIRVAIFHPWMVAL